MKKHEYKEAMKNKEQQITFDEIKSASCDLIRQQCSYVSINAGALGGSDCIKPIETSVLFTAPQLIETHIPLPEGIIDIIIDKMDKHIAELKAELEAAQNEPRVLSINNPSYFKTSKGYLAYDPDEIDTLIAELDAEDVETPRSHNVLVIGQAGAGKSILLNRLALWLTDQVEEESVTKPENLERDSSNQYFKEWLCDKEAIQGFAGKVPLLLRCHNISVNKGSDDLVHQVVKEMFPTEDEEELLSCLKQLDPTSFVVLIDGLDELPYGVTVDALFDAVLKLFGLDMNPLCELSLFVTTRETAVANIVLADTLDNILPEDYYGIQLDPEIRLGPGFGVYGIQPLNQMEPPQRGDFVYHLAYGWYFSQNISEGEAEKRATLLRDTVQADWQIRFQNFLRSPLELILCLYLFGSTESFPTTEHELYSRFICARLRWRSGWASPHDLFLLLAYCALMTAYYSGKSGRFELSVPKEKFLKWLEMGYRVLGSRIELIRDRGFTSLAEAAKHDLNELITVHGILRASGDNISFEHRQLQVFLAERGLVQNVCPSLFPQVYSEIYASKKEEGVLEGDWFKFFKFLVQDKDVFDSSLQAMWSAVAAADCEKYTKKESEVFLAILMDGRIAVPAQIKFLKPLLTAFCSVKLIPSQLDVYRKLATDSRYFNVVNSIENLYQSSGDYEYCFVAATFDIFSALQYAEEPDDTSYILPWNIFVPYEKLNATPSDEKGTRWYELPKSEEVDDKKLDRALFRLEMLFFFREINGNNNFLEFANDFFDGGKEERNRGVDFVIKYALKRLCNSAHDLQITNTIRILVQLLESHTCREMAYKAISNGEVSLSELLLAMQDRLRGCEPGLINGETNKDKETTTNEIRLLSALCFHEDFITVCSGNDFSALKGIVKDIYIATARIAAKAEFSRSDKYNKEAIQAIVDACAFDEVLSAYLKPFLIRCPCEGNERTQSQEASLNTELICSAIKESQYWCRLADEDAIFVAASMISAARLNLVDKQVLLLISEITAPPLESNEIDGGNHGFASPGETLAIFWYKSRQLGWQMKYKKK